jgi:hypothetical protein
MRLAYVLALGVATISLSALAQMPPPPPPPEEIQALHDCAAKSGVDLPPPGPDGPPRLNEAERKLVDACFESLGIKKPPHHPAPPLGIAKPKAIEM